MNRHEALIRLFSPLGRDLMEHVRGIMLANPNALDSVDHITKPDRTLEELLALGGTHRGNDSKDC